jgi:excisionase family DNA binding protein
MAEQFLTVDQAASRLQVSGYTLREWLKAGRVHGVKIGTKWRVPERALTELARPQQPEQQAPEKTPNTWSQSAERLSDVYARSIADDDELTAITTAPGDFHEPTGENPQ